MTFVPWGRFAIAPVALALLLATAGAPSTPVKVEVLEAPREREPGCVVRALRLPEGARPPRRALLKFRVGRSGWPESIEILEPAPGPVAEALAAALRACAFEPLRASADAAARVWTVLPLRFTDREPPWDRLGDPPRTTDAPAGSPLPARAPVVDPGGLVDGASLSRLYALAQEARGAGRPVLTILVVPTLAGEDPRDLAARAYLGWRLGSTETDDGLLLVVAQQERDWLLQPGLAVWASVADAGLLKGLETRLAEGGRARALGPALVEVAGRLDAVARAESGPRAERAVPGLDDEGTEVLSRGLVSGLSALAAAVVGALVTWWRRRRRPSPPGRPAGEPLWLEVRERKGCLEVRSGTASAGLGWLGLALAALLLWGLLQRADRGTEVLTCSRGSGRCTLTRGASELAWVSLDATARFFATPGRRKESPELRAVTRQGNLLLLTWNDRAELARQAEELNAFLVGQRGDELTFQYDYAGNVWTDGLGVLGLLLAMALPTWILVGTVTLSIDRAAGTVTLRRPLWRSRRPLAALVAVRVWSRRLDQIEKARRTRRPVPYALPADDAKRLVLVDATGRRWPATRWLQPGVAQSSLVAAARRVSDFTGIPLAPDEPDPPPGLVPPPLP